jgi:hypothetical protein
MAVVNPTWDIGAEVPRAIHAGGNRNSRVDSRIAQLLVMLTSIMAFVDLLILLVSIR